MKTSNTETLIIRDNIGAETAFTIKATGKAFKILSDGLYTDKILAIIRELSCNAYDAHVAAGKVNEPFDVTLPSQLDPVFRIRDYGTGLDHHQVMHLYTSYFESTKTDSNDFIGALGLGSKSPFSYVDSFIVNSFFNGTKRLYTAFIAEQGVPSITLLGEEPTKEANGLEIIVPVKKREDYRSFEDKAKKVYRYFKVRPNLKHISAFTYTNDEPVLTGSNWALYKKEYHGGLARVLQGNVAYPIQLNAFTGALATQAAEYSNLFNSNLLVEYPIGELEVAASREALSMDGRTQRNLLASITNLRQEIVVELEKLLDAAPTRWEARALLSEMANWSDFIYELSRKGSLIYKGEKLSVSFSIKMENHKGLKIFQWYSYGKSPRRIHQYIAPDPKAVQKRDPYDSYIDMTPADNKNATFWIDDIGHTVHSRIRSIRDGGSTYVISIDLPATVNHRKAPEVQKFVQGNADIQKLVDAFEGVTFKYVSEIPKPVRDKESVRRRGKFFSFDPTGMLTYPYYAKEGDLRTVRSDGLAGAIRRGWTEQEIDLKDLAKAPWMEIFKFMPTKHDADQDKFGKIYALATYLKLIKDDTPVYGIREKDVPKLNLSADNEFIAYLRRLCEAEINKRGLKEKVRMNSEHAKVVAKVGWDLINFYSKCTDELAAMAKFKASYKRIQFTELSTKDKDLYGLGEMLELKDIQASNESVDVIAAHKEIISRYPLLPVVIEHQKNHWNAKVDPKAIESYIKAIDIVQPLAVA